ncbi:Man1-Src1p-C-terminal domain-containing protein [Cyathus striatus]|nr:Man1-Src1p-C-terminal domain-containing protein [Cyathus striatus]
MSRLTAAQIIAVGDYLQPDFDPVSLTVSQLLGVLGYHNIRYPTPYSKPKLVALFNEEIKPNIAKLKRERLKKENSIASEDGITDGITGQPIKEKAPARRSSRRLSKAPLKEEDETDIVLPEPPKRRRSSAQPRLGGTSRKVVVSQPIVAEESEPEEMELPINKIGRSKKNSEAAGTRARRISSAADDSGWEDNNIFQSGAESSSPVRPSPARAKGRKSVGPRKSRHSMSAPPDVSDSPTRPGVIGDRFEVASPAFAFKPLSPIVLPRGTLSPQSQSAVSNIPPIRESKQETETVVPATLRSDKPVASTTIEHSPRNLVVSNVEVEDELEQDSSEFEIAIPPENDQILLDIPPDQTRAVSTAWRLFFVMAIVTLSVTGYQYKQESSAIGYCEPGTTTNHYLENFKVKRAAIELCNKENRTQLESGEPCPLPPLFPILHPERCTQCPKHAKCSQYTVTCENGYLLHPTWYLSFLPPPPQDRDASQPSSFNDLLWRTLSMANGLPGSGSIAFPPRCLEDPKRKRNIGALGKAIESLLGQERGRRLCSGTISTLPMQGEIEEAKKWGVEMEKLRDATRKKTASYLLPTFDDTFDDAIQQLVQWGGVIIGEDQNGHRYLAHKTPELTWNCAIIVKSREIWEQWRSTVLGTAIAIFLGFLMRVRIARREAESKRVSELVQFALEALRNQEIAHHTDPVTTPQPYLSSLQLRDLILQEEHSIPTRRRLWNQVERVVEGNANVRANLEEIEGGDEMRVWRWVGNAGVRKQLT